MNLITFGDSHSWVGWKFSVPNLSILHGKNGPFTMARFGMEKLNLLNIKNSSINDGDVNCFSFGEIDCRSHICKPRNMKEHITLIDDIVIRYFEAIKMNVDQFKNLTTMILCVVPTPIKNNTIPNPEYPFEGTDNERKSVTLHMNLKLKEYCKKYNYVFLDVYDKYCDKDGYLNKELSDGHVHIKNGIYIQEFLINFIKHE